MTIMTMSHVPSTNTTTIHTAVDMETRIKKRLSLTCLIQVMIKKRTMMMTNHPIHHVEDAFTVKIAVTYTTQTWPRFQEAKGDNESQRYIKL